MMVENACVEEVDEKGNRIVAISVIVEDEVGGKVEKTKGKIESHRPVRSVEREQVK